MANLKAELLTLLANLPNMDEPAERKAFLSFAGYPHLGIYLDWSGSALQFAERLIEELSRRGKRFLVSFLDAMQSVPQLGVDRKEPLGVLRNRIDALDGAAWQAAFPMEPLTPAQRLALAADKDMLAA